MTRHYIIWYAIVLHFVWGSLLLVHPVGLRTTPVSAMATVSNGSAPGLGLILLGAAGLALTALFYPFPRAWQVTVLCVPQQFLLFLSAGGAVAATWAGMYADGVPRPHLFIFMDQFPTMLAAILHSLAITVGMKSL